MVSLTALIERLRADAVAWRDLRIGDLLFAHASEAAMVLIAAAGLSVAVLAWRLALGRRLGRNLITLPALLTGFGSRFSALRHLPLLLVLAGLPCFVLALADPYTAGSERQISYPGKRIAILLDDNGHVCEGSGENIFVVRDGVIATPPLRNFTQSSTISGCSAAMFFSAADHLV